MTVTPYLRRITVVLAILVAVTWMLGLFSIIQLGRVQEKSRDIAEQALQSTVVLGQMASDLNAYWIRHAKLARRVAGERHGRGHAELRRLEGRMAANSRMFESLDASDEEMRLFMKFLVNWRSYVRQSETLAASPPSARDDSAVASDAKLAFEAAGLALEQLIRINVEQGKMALAEAERIHRSSMGFIVAAMMLTTLIITGSLLVIVRHEFK